jgi:hypothetical protein
MAQRAIAACSFRRGELKKELIGHRRIRRLVRNFGRLLADRQLMTEPYRVIGKGGRIAPGEILPMNFVASREMSPLPPSTGRPLWMPISPMRYELNWRARCATLPGTAP